MIKFGILSLSLLTGMLLSHSALAQDEAGAVNTTTGNIQGSGSESVKQTATPSETPGQVPTPEPPPHKFSVFGETVNFTTPDVSQNAQRFSLKREESNTVLTSYGGQADVYQGRAVNLKYRGIKGFAATSWNPKPDFNVDFAGGVNQILFTPDGDSEVTRTESYLNLNLSNRFSPSVLVHARETHDLLYSDWVDPALARTLMLANISEAVVDWDPAAHWHGKVTGRNVEMSDHNGQNTLEGQVLREVVSTPFSLWVGLGSGTMGYREQTPAYWSPARKTATGLRSELHCQLGRSVAADANFNASATEQYQAPPGNDFFWEAHFHPVQQSRLQWNLFTTHIESNGGGTNWTRNDVGVNLNYAL